jgi:hypothetical protein
LGYTFTPAQLPEAVELEATLELEVLEFTLELLLETLLEELPIALSLTVMSELPELW